jgi:nucleoporin GLE1
MHLYVSFVAFTYVCILTSLFRKRTARRTQRALQARIHDEREKAHIRDSERRAALHARQVAEVQARLSAMELQQKTEEAKLREGWKERERKLWERIDAAIKLEEERTRQRLEAERKAKEEEERKRLEEEMKKRLEEEKKRQEEEERRKAEEEERRKKLEEEEAKKRKEEEERMKEERLQEDQKALGVSTAEEDWSGARVTLKVRIYLPL